MITKTDIINFFDVEAETAKKSWEATMKLSLEDRIRKRKAIYPLFLDRDYKGFNEENYFLHKLRFRTNLSDFKEGDCLILHREESIFGIECNINSFEGEASIIIEIFKDKYPSDLDSYYDTPLVLDKSYLDLREKVYYPFAFPLPEKNDNFWKTLLFNSKVKPLFEDFDKNTAEVEDTAKNYELELLPCQKEAIIKSISAKDYFLIQGPPGTGKSFVLSLIILEEALYLDQKVIVIGPNHMAINNTLEQIVKLAPFYLPLIRKVGQIYHAPKKTVPYEDKECKIPNIHHLNPNGPLISSGASWIIGLTPHSLYSSRANFLKCDTLIIDEAGQMTIPMALMGMVKAKKVILAGDHKQLPPIITSEAVPDYMKKSAFETLMTDDNYTLLDTSFRMCEPICEFVSEIFYDGKVKAYKKGCGEMVVCNNPLYSFDKPVVIHQVDDNGMQSSDKEAEFIVETITELLKKGVPSYEIAVLSPFRAQAATVRREIRKCNDISDEDKKSLVADTVDKMQGQEREVIIYSFTAGDPEYITEMADFLYKPNKLNVAFSRAKSKLIIVGNFKAIKDKAGEEYPHLSDMLYHRNVTKV